MSPAATSMGAPAGAGTWAGTAGGAGVVAPDDGAQAPAATPAPSATAASAVTRMTFSTGHRGQGCAVYRVRPMSASRPTERQAGEGLVLWLTGLSSAGK